MDTNILRKIGLTEGEIKVYLALFHLGSSTAGPIAKEAKVARSKLYDILDRLSKKGLVSHSLKNNIKYFSTADPSRILDFLRLKKEELEKQEEEVKKQLPLIEQEFELKDVKLEAEVFEGLEGLKNVREQYIKSMKKNDVIYFIGVPSSAYDKMEAYYTDWNKRRIGKGIMSHTIFTDEARNHPYVEQKKKHRLTVIKFLPKGILTYSWIEIYHDTIIIAINYKKPMSIVINNKYVAESYKQYFNLLWRIAK